MSVLYENQSEQENIDQGNSIQAKEAILKKHIGEFKYNELPSTREKIFAAMDEYSSQLIKERDGLIAELEGTKEIAMARGEAIFELQYTIESRDKEIERLKGLIENMYCKGIKMPYGNDWRTFKSENNL